MTDTYTPPQNTSALILQWLRRCRESQFVHYAVATKYQEQNSLFGIPAIALNALVSASLFATFLKSENAEIRMGALGLSLLSIVLSSLQTYLKPSEKAEMHRIAGAEYAELRRKLEVIHAIGSTDQAKLEQLEKEISALAKRAPNVSLTTFEKVKKDVG